MAGANIFIIANTHTKYVVVLSFKIRMDMREFFFESDVTENPKSIPSHSGVNPSPRTSGALEVCVDDTAEVIRFVSPCRRRLSDYYLSSLFV